MLGLTLYAKDFAHTTRSLVGACCDWLILRTPVGRFPRKRTDTFAFLVHPRNDEFTAKDAYGFNDIYRPFPFLRHIYNLLPGGIGKTFILSFACSIIPITLACIRVCASDRTYRGYLLSTVRTPNLLLNVGAHQTRTHLNDLFLLAARKGVGHVGLGALLPSMTGYGLRLANNKTIDRPAVSTGHAYTGYVIVEYLKFLASRGHTGAEIPNFGIVGAAGSTGKAVLRVLKRTWNGAFRLNLLLVDVPRKNSALHALSTEAQQNGAFFSVRTATDLSALKTCNYIAVVTNATAAIIKPEHLTPGSVLIDDSQPRNTSQELVQYGCHVVDVLARVTGLDCHFDFGFRTRDPSVTFTCLAETVLATIVGDHNDLAVGEVTDETVDRMLRIVGKARGLGLIGPLPFFTFGREMTQEEQDLLLRPA